MILKTALSLAMGIVILMLAIRILIWQWRPNTRPCRWFGHDRKYVAIKIVGCVAADDPTSNGKPFVCGHDHKIGEKGIYQARWVCRRCPEMKEECLGGGKDWKIEHEKLVPDVKKWANWSQEPPPPADAMLAARQKLAEIQKRISPATDAQVEDDRKAILKERELHDCKGCGAQHTGPCVPGAIS